MKTVKITAFACIVILLLSACSNHQMRIQIPSKERIVLDYPNYEVYMAGLQNRSLTTLDIKADSKKGDEKARSFGYRKCNGRKRKPFGIVEQWKSNYKTKSKHCGG